MLSVRNVGWARIEGSTISNLKKNYGTLSGIPNSEQFIYYGHPEIQFSNPTSTIHSTVYTVQTLEEKFGYTKQDGQIKSLDEDWSVFESKIQTWMNTNLVDISESNTAYYNINSPFTVSESCVIFYDDSSKTSITGSKYSHYLIILIDEEAQPNVVSIQAEYNGDAVPIGEAFDESLLTVEAVYDDGQKQKISSGYTLIPSDKIITKLGANLFNVEFIDDDNDLNSISFIVQGTRNLVSIHGKWDGGYVGIGKEAKKKYFVIVAHYSDDTESIVNDFSFPNTNIVSETNQGLIDIYYKGKTCEVQVPTYNAKLIKIVAFYNGPDIEVGNEYQESYLEIKGYKSTGEEGIVYSEYEPIDVSLCTIDSKEITKEGPNTFIVTFSSDVGELSASFSVNGFNPEVKPTQINAEYTGPDIYQGGIVDIERIIVNIYYSDGKIKTTKNFSLNTNIVSEIGPNEIVVTYKESGTEYYEDIIIVNGLENDSTTQNNIFPAEFKNKYPIATKLNNRFRGPAEGIKTNEISRMISDNIIELYKIFTDLEKQYNEIINYITDANNSQIMTLNNVSYIEKQCNDILNDTHYSTGVYKTEEE